MAARATEPNRRGCQWHRPLFATPTSHIVKLPIGFLSHSNIDLRDSNENEWLCLKILEAFGLPVANAELSWFGQHTVLVVERFDRRWSRIEPRHFMSTAQQVGFSHQRAMDIAQSLLDQAGSAISRVEALLPADFPDNVSEPILEGLGQQLKKLADETTQ